MFDTTPRRYSDVEPRGFLVKSTGAFSALFCALHLLDTALASCAARNPPLASLLKAVGFVISHTL